MKRVRRLEGKFCIVTGAARGIGRGIVERFHEEGATVLLTDVDEDAGKAAASAFGAEFVPLDVRDEQQWAELADAHPACDVLVNNAGITGLEHGGHTHDPEHATLEEWHAVHRTNLDGTFLGCRYAIRAMKAKGAGSIINISSRSGLVGIPGAAAYASSKAAIRNHSKSVALYCAQQGWKIRCNSVHPAAIMTDIWEAMVGDGADREQRMARLVADTPLKRFGTVEEVAALVAYLAADESAYTTGSEFDIDGGLLAGSAASPG
jgi:NAD(P)-dependent dehydrogenase (short-subunit alcohol dehydrogenase family)